MQKSKMLVVIGMSRSGTSFLSGWLHRSGIPMGSRFLEADDIMNTRGFFEDMDFLDIHLAISARNKDRVERMYEYGDPGFTFSKEDIQRAQAVLSRRTEAQWGWKVTAKPHEMWSLFWKPLLDTNGLNYTVMASFRHYESCIRSCMRVKYLKRQTKGGMGFLKLKWFPDRYANRHLKEWIIANREILRHAKAYDNILVTDSAELLENGAKVAGILREKFGFELADVDPKSLYEKELMDRPVDIRYTLDPTLEAEARNIYEQLIQLKEAYVCYEN